MKVNNELRCCFVSAIYNGTRSYSRLSRRLESAKKQLAAPCAAAWQGMQIHRFEVGEGGLADLMNTKHKTDRRANHQYKGHFGRNFLGQVKGRHPPPCPQPSIALHDFVPSWAVERSNLKTSDDAE
jgi:hypothetical protein